MSKVYLVLKCSKMNKRSRLWNKKYKVENAAQWTIVTKNHWRRKRRRRRRRRKKERRRDFVETASPARGSSTFCEPTRAISERFRDEYRTHYKAVYSVLLVHGQVTIIFVVYVCLFVCLFVCAEFFSAAFDPIWIKLVHILHVRV